MTLVDEIVIAGMSGTMRSTIGLVLFLIAMYFFFIKEWDFNQDK